MNSPVITYYNIADNVTAFSTTRHGGVSKGNYGEFNINIHSGDRPEDVLANRRILSGRLEVPSKNIFMPHQVHGTNVLVIDDEFLNSDKVKQIRRLEGVDSVISDKLGICFGVSTADCIPILLYDTEHHAAAAVHAGWRGTVKNIVKATMFSMQLHFDTYPKFVNAVIGPGISLKNFEVGDEVYRDFVSAGFNMTPIARQFPAFIGDGTEVGMKWHIDLPQCNRLQLEKAGVPADNIIMSDICTYDNYVDYFSARRLGPKSGRIYTGIILR